MAARQDPKSVIWIAFTAGKGQVKTVSLTGSILVFQTTSLIIPMSVTILMRWCRSALAKSLRKTVFFYSTSPKTLEIYGERFALGVRERFDLGNRQAKRSLDL